MTLPKAMPKTDLDFPDWMAAVQDRTEAALARCLPAATTAPERLHAAMRYAVLGGGKRVRPLLCHGAGEIFDTSPTLLDAPACAVELIHAYSLVHDDLPCMDDDVLRRGKPTCHVEYDEATALLVGDALQSLPSRSWPNKAAPCRCCSNSPRRRGPGAWRGARPSTWRRSALP